MIEKGTHIATAQQIPTKLMNTIACQVVSIETLYLSNIKDTWDTVVIKKVENMSRLKNNRAPVQILRSKKGMTGRRKGFPCDAASTRHPRTVSLNRLISAF